MTCFGALHYSKFYCMKPKKIYLFMSGRTLFFFFFEDKMFRSTCPTPTYIFWILIWSVFASFSQGLQSKHPSRCFQVRVRTPSNLLLLRLHGDRCNRAGGCHPGGVSCHLGPFSDKGFEIFPLGLQGSHLHGAQSTLCPCQDRRSATSPPHKDHLQGKTTELNLYYNFFTPPLLLK